MTALTTIIHLFCGLAVGLGIAWAHVHAARRAAASALAGESRTRLLLGFPIRVAVPAAALFALALVSLAALAGGMLGFVVGQRLVLARTKEGL